MIAYVQKKLLIMKMKMIESHTDTDIDDDDDDDDDDDEDNDGLGSVMTSYLPVGYQADRGTLTRGSQRRPQGSKFQAGINHLISWNGDLDGGTVILPMAGAP